MINNILILAGLFALLNLPDAYKISNNIVKAVVKTTNTSITGECFNTTGLLVHTFIFFILTLALMSLNNVFDTKNDEDRPTVWQLVKQSFCGTLLFYILSSKDTYQLLAGKLNKDTLTNGCPNNNGVLIHAAIYFLINYVLSL